LKASFREGSGSLVKKREETQMKTAGKRRSLRNDGQKKMALPINMTLRLARAPRVVKQKAEHWKLKKKKEPGFSFERETTLGWDYRKQVYLRNGNQGTSCIEKIIA